MVDTTGNITQIKASSKGNPLINKQGKLALKKVNQKLQTIGGIKPAHFEDGTKVNLVYSIPIKFRYDLEPQEQDVNTVQEYTNQSKADSRTNNVDKQSEIDKLLSDYKEFIVLSNYDNDKFYQLRLNLDKETTEENSFYLYEYSNDRKELLNRYNTNDVVLNNELSQVFENLGANSNKEKYLVNIGEINNQTYKVYGFLNQDNVSQLKIYQIEGNNETFVEELDFSKSDVESVKKILESKYHSLWFTAVQKF